MGGQARWAAGRTQCQQAVLPLCTPGAKASLLMPTAQAPATSGSWPFQISPIPDRLCLPVHSGCCQ